MHTPAAAASTPPSTIIGLTGFKRPHIHILALYFQALVDYLNSSERDTHTIRTHKCSPHAHAHTHTHIRAPNHLNK